MHRKRISVYCDWATDIATVVITRFGNGRRSHKVARFSPSAHRILGILADSPHIYHARYGKMEAGMANWQKDQAEENTFHYYYRQEKVER